MNEVEKKPGGEAEMPQQDVQEPAPKPAPAPARPKQKKGSGLLWLVGLLIGLGVAFAAAQYFGVFGSEEEGADETTQVDPATVVATVNNVEITRGELDEKIGEVVATMPGGAAAPDDAAFELQVLDEIINIELLTQKAVESGVVVSDEEVDTELNNLKETLGGEEAFAQQLELAGLTEAQLLENMQTELLIRKLLDQETDLEDVSVTDEEVEAFYNDAVASVPEGQEIPPLADAEEFVRAQLTQEKSADIVNAYLDELRNTVDIEVILE